mgnify:CR=1 FL=1
MNADAMMDRAGSRGKKTSDILGRYTALGRRKSYTYKNDTGPYEKKSRHLWEKRRDLWGKKIGPYENKVGTYENKSRHV